MSPRNILLRKMGQTDSSSWCFLTVTATRLKTGCPLRRLAVHRFAGSRAIPRSMWQSAGRSWAGALMRGQRRSLVTINGALALQRTGSISRRGGAVARPPLHRCVVPPHVRPRRAAASLPAEARSGPTLMPEKCPTAVRPAC